MADEFGNIGSVSNAETMRDVTTTTNIAREINQQATTVICSNAIFHPNSPASNTSFKNIPEPHGAFVGRVEFVESAIKYLSHPSVAVGVQIQFNCLVIHALGGYGKTQTARKIASVCKNKRKFQQFIWIDSEDDLSIKKCFVAAMKQVGLNASDKSVDAAHFDSLMHQFYDILVGRKKEKFLIIFDNVVDFDNILKFLPLNYRGTNFAVLMTSQRPFTRESYGHVRNQSLYLMPEAEAIELVENILGTLTTEDKKLIVERSGRIVLVLCVMASTIKFQRRYKSDYRLKDYLKEMSDHPIQYSDESKWLDLGYDKSLQKIVRFAVDKLNAIGGLIEIIAVKVFDRLAYCSSTNWFHGGFVQNYFRDIFEEIKNVDIKLPIKPVDSWQIIRMAIEKLSEFSLVQIDRYEITIHRWIQASRRLDLKNSGNGRTVVKQLLINMSKKDRINSIIWQHATDYAGLVTEFYAETKTLLKFPYYDVNELEQIIRQLTESTDFRPFENYSKEVEEIVCRHIKRRYIYSSLHMVKRIVNVFNYDVSKNSKKLFSIAVSTHRLDIIEWLVGEESFIADEDNLRQCFQREEIDLLADYLEDLKDLNIEITERRPGKNLFERALNKLESLGSRDFTTKSNAISVLLSALPDSHPLKIQLCEAIEKNCGKHLLERILDAEPKSMVLPTETYCPASDWPSDCIEVFEIIKIALSALEKWKSSIELDDIRKKYSVNNLLECLFICGRQHFCMKEYHFDAYASRNVSWNDLHRAAYENNLTAIVSIDPVLIESKDNRQCTPLMIAVEAAACEATTILLEKYSANVNAMNNCGETPLEKAVTCRHPSMCNILLSHGAKTHWESKSGRSVHALLIAIDFLDNYDGSEPEEIVVALLNTKNCDVCATDCDGNNILHLLVLYYYATRYKPNHRMLQLILSANADLVNMQNRDGLTPVQLAKNLRVQFSDDHWHVASLNSFISEIGKVCN